MGQEKLYEISKMKDLSTIYFYDLAQSKSSKVPSFVGLRVTYGKDESLGYEYNSEYFDTFLKKVIELYEEEKNNGKIKFFDDYSKESLKTIIELKSEEPKKKEGYLTSLLNSEAKYNSLNDIKPYLEKVFSELISYIRKEEFKVISIHGINDKYLMRLSNGYEMPAILQIPITVKKVKGNEYSIKASCVNDNINLIDCSLIIENDYIDIEAYVNNVIYKCHYGLNKYLNDNSIRDNDKLVWFAEPDLSLSDDEEKLVNFYSEKFLGTVLQDKIKTAPNHYILSGTNLSGDRYTTTNLNMIIADDNKIKMKYRIKKGIARQVKNEYLYVPYDEEYGQKVIKHFSDRNHDDFMVEETKIDPFMIKSVDLPKTLATYYYDLYKVEGFTTFTDSLPLIDKVDMDDNGIKHTILINR